MDVFYKYGTDFYILVRNGAPKYFIDLSFYGEGLAACDCMDYECRRDSIVQRGLVSECRHVKELKNQLKKENNENE